MPAKKLTDDQRRDATLRRMLMTPPKPFTPPATVRPEQQGEKKK